MRFNKWKGENYYQITQPTPSAILSCNKLKRRWMAYEWCGMKSVCVPVFWLCSYFKLFQVTQCQWGLPMAQQKLSWRRKWVSISWVLLLHIEQNHISTTHVLVANERFGTQDVGWFWMPRNSIIFFFLKTVKYFSNIEEMQQGSVDCMVHWEPWSLCSLAIC